MHMCFRTDCKILGSKFKGLVFWHEICIATVGK